MIDPSTSKTGNMRDACTRECITHISGKSSASPDASPRASTSLKAASLLILERISPCINRASPQKNTTHILMQKTGGKYARDALGDGGDLSDDKTPAEDDRREPDYPEFDEEALHLAWVYHFDEQEPETAVFMCAVNHRQALAFHPCAIAAVPLTVADGVSCKTCLHCSRPGGWPAPALCGGRTDLPPAFGDNHPLRIQPEDGGTDCGAYRHISEKGKS